MSNPFTSTLRVIAFDELQTLFYTALADETAKNPNLSVEQSREYAIALLSQAKEINRYDLKADLQISFDKLCDIISKITDKIKAPRLQTYWMSLFMNHWEDKNTSLQAMLNLLAASYANILLDKGCQVITNPVFVFDKSLVKSCLESRQTSLCSPVGKMPPLYLHFEYFYFDHGNTTKYSFHLQEAGAEFVKLFFNALHSYSATLPEENVVSSFANYVK